MKTQRFIGDFDLSQKSLEISDKNFINQIKNVFRMKPGDLIFLVDGKSKEAETKISEISAAGIKLEILNAKQNENESPVYGVLYAAILKKQNFELVAQKAVEAGIKEITPIIAARTVKTEINPERLRVIIKEAAEQSERGILPKLNLHLSFKEALETAKENSSNFIFDRIGLSSAKDIKLKPESKIGIFTGPEGGWTEEELRLAKDYGFKIINLGKTVLRAETAAIIASHLIENQG
ncbi:MAG: 16S rRNA (uracil(1498)-N(3))-methyltransferase [Patescibacteria group bacterium]|nr:16S rRNA (uracil(1498)-N(3))-methyltransferase [Patescibacteria group bacterium]